MTTKLRCALIFVVFVLGGALCAYAQLRPEVTVKPKPKKPPAAKVTPKPAEKPAAKPVPPRKTAEPEPAPIVVETSPNAEVYLDDQFVGRASPQGRLVVANPAPGERRLRVTLAGKRDYEAKAIVVAGQVANVAASLADLPGRVLVRSSPGAEVFIDGSSRGSTGGSGELVIADLEAGSHELRIAATGKREHRQNITLTAGQETRIEATLEDLAPTAGEVRENPKDGLDSPAERPSASVPGGVLFVSFRTPLHQKHSSHEVFQEITDNLILFLKSNNVLLHNDASRRMSGIYTRPSVYELISVAKKVGASSLIFLTVDRPLSAWVKLTVECYDLNGGLIWEEKASDVGWFHRGAAGVSNATRALESKLAKRIGTSGLPVSHRQD